MHCALKLIKNKEKFSIQDILNITGYKDSEYFSKIFKAYYKKTPLEVKESPLNQKELLQNFRGLQCGTFNILESNKYHIIKQYIESLELKNLGLLNVSIIAVNFKINSTSLTKGFKKTHDIRLNFYINKIKMEKCAEILSGNSDLTVKTVAILAGFSRTDYFRKIFKKFIGKTPIKCKKT